MGDDSSREAYPTEVEAMSVKPMDDRPIRYPLVNLKALSEDARTMYRYGLTWLLLHRHRFPDCTERPEVTVGFRTTFTYGPGRTPETTTPHPSFREKK